MWFEVYANEMIANNLERGVKNARSVTKFNEGRENVPVFPPIPRDNYPPHLKRYIWRVSFKGLSGAQLFFTLRDSDFRKQMRAL